MEKVLKGIKNSFGKIGTAYKKLSEKDARIDTIVTISGVMLFAFLVMFTCQKIMGVNAVSIATNKAEASFLMGIMMLQLQNMKNYRKMKSGLFIQLRLQRYIQ